MPSWRTSLSVHQNKAIWRHIPIPSPTCTTAASAPAASALLQGKASNKRRSAMIPTRFLFDVCEVRSWGTPHHGSPDTVCFPPVWPHSLSQHIFLTLSGSLVSINYIVSVALHTLDYLDLAKTSLCKSNSSQQLVPSAQHRIPTHRSFQSPGQDRSWWWCSSELGDAASMWPTYKKNTSANPVLYLSLGAENKGKATGSSGSQSASHPNHGKIFLWFPSAVHHNVAHQTTINVTYCHGSKEVRAQPGNPSRAHWKSWRSSFSTVLLPLAYQVPVMCGRTAKTKVYPTQKTTIWINKQMQSNMRAFKGA